jgi:predicted HAD superfamily Cof-like phosphohydrolase
MGLLQSQAAAWRQAFEVESNREKGSQQFNLQIHLIQEEYGETLEALFALDTSSTESKAEALKELADLVFVCYQAAENMGWDLDEAVQRVFISNMSKLDDSGRAIRNNKGKVLKGPKYCLPSLNDLVEDEPKE